MNYPNFQPISTKNPLGDSLKVFFLDTLGYHHIDKDPDDTDPDRPEAWHMVVPIEGSRPFAIAYRRGLATMRRREVSRLYIDRVIPHRDDSPSVLPVLYGFTDGARVVVFSADPARNRDDRFDLSEETWRFQAVQDKFQRLYRDRLEFQTRLGQKRPLVEFLFEGSPLSSDKRFKRYVQWVRTGLMEAVLDDEQALASVLYFLIETPESRETGDTHFATQDRHLKKSREDLHLEIGMRLGDALAGAVDTLLLRYVMVRFLEAYHPEAMQGLLKSEEVLQSGKGGRKVAPSASSKGGQGELLPFGGAPVAVVSFSDTELELARQLTEPLGIDVSKARKKVKGKDERQPDLFAFEDEAALARTVLSEEEKRASRLGGDFYLADLGCAARAIEEALLTDPKSKGAKLLQDFLGRTGAPEMAQWDFRYEDLRPQTLQDYYESSLGTAVQLSFNARTKDFEIAVGQSKRQRKELGAYYTAPRLCRFMVERTVKPLFVERQERLRQAIARKDQAAAQTALDTILGMSICDPTMGSAPFLRSAFDYLSEQYLPLCRDIADAKEKLPAFYDATVRTASFLTTRGGRMDDEGWGRFEWHILRRMLYGVDIDLKAVCIACQTFALSALKYLKQGERFPSFFNLNLKLGNALISPVTPSDRAMLAENYGAKIARLIQLRNEAMTLPNTEKAYERLAVLLQEIDVVKGPIIRALLQERVAPILQDFTEDLRPFCWELEFPEVFFTEEGFLKKEAGFDVMIGNPPWEAIKFHDTEFLRSIGAESNDVATLAKQNPGVATAYNHYLGEIEAWKRWVSSGGQYEHQQGGRDRNKWRFATEVAWKLTSPVGAMSLVVPGGIIADEGGIALKLWIFPEGEAGTFVSFEKSNDIFSGTQAFTVMDFRKGRPTHLVGHLEGLTRAEQLFAWPYEPSPLSIELVEKMSPDVLAIPSIRDDIDRSLLEKLYRHPLIGDLQQTWYAKTVSYDYHMSNDRKHFQEDGKGIPLLEGKSIAQYEVIPLDQIRIHVPARRQVEPGGQYRVACAKIAGTLDPRRMLCTVLPHDYATGDALNCFLVDGNDAERLFLVGVLNSFVIEWRVRQLARNNNIVKFALLQIPVPRPPRPVVERIAALVATLVTADERFEDLMSLLKNHKSAREAHDRHEIKCQIDAEVARLFDLSGSELDRVLSAYDKVPEGTKRRVRELFSSEASATSQNKALTSEARRLIEAHREEYPRLQPGEVLLAAAVLQQVDEEAGDLALVEIVHDFQLEPGMAAPPVASWPSTLSSTLLPRLRFFVLGLADLGHGSLACQRAREELRGWEIVDSQEWIDPEDDPLLPQVLEI
jgi:hypothetical protein